MRNQTTHPLEVAVQIAVRAHAGALDKSGQPYILHPLRVMQAQQTNDARMAGVLHDVVEDSDVTLTDLREAGIPESVLEAIALLTHDEVTPYEIYVQTLKSNPLARSVKLADLRDNMNVLRLPEFTEKDLRRLEKYRRAYETLCGDDSKSCGQATL